jgi:hypothetical protein
MKSRASMAIIYSKSTEDVFFIIKSIKAEKVSGSAKIGDKFLKITPFCGQSG